MKALIVVAFLVSFCLGQRLNPNDPKCNLYLEKFGTANNPDGSGASKIAFTGDVSFITGTSNVKVSLRYQDALNLFNDPTLFGLVQEDGKTAANTCLDLKLWKFTSNTYADPVQVKDLPISPSSDCYTTAIWRYYSFTIPGAELGTRLVQTSNSAQFIYKGFYAIVFYAADTEEVKYTFYFEFSVTVQRATSTQVDTSFKPLSYTSVAGCTPNYACNPKLDSVLRWCTDLTCTSNSTPDLHLKDHIVLQQVVTTAGMDYYLTGTEVWYTGNGLNEKATIVSVINATKGQVIILLKAKIVWGSVTFRVTSILSTIQEGGRRILVQTTYDPVTGETDEPVCIKAKGSDTCPTCKQEFEANGYSSESCSSSFSKQIEYIFLALLLAFAI